MCWKKMPAWLKGGIIVLSIDMILAAIFWIILCISFSQYSPISLLFPTITIPGGLILKVLGLQTDLSMLIPVLALSILIYLLIGIFIYWLIGKIKSGKRKK